MKETIRVLVEQTALEDRSASKIVDSLLAFHALRRSLRIDAKRTVELIHQAVQKQATPKWVQAYGSDWEKARSILVELFDPANPFASLEKGLQLAYSYQNVLTGVRLLTELRPVFDASGESVARGLITFVLSLEYSDGTTRRLDLALDATDVSELKRLCGRAEKKATALAESVAQAWPTTIVGGK